MGSLPRMPVQRRTGNVLILSLESSNQISTQPKERAGKGGLMFHKVVSYLLENLELAVHS